jgi:hypothetical protein
MAAINGALIGTSGEDGSVRIWDPATAKLLRVIAERAPIADATSDRARLFLSGRNALPATLDSNGARAAVAYDGEDIIVRGGEIRFLRDDSRRNDTITWRDETHANSGVVVLPKNLVPYRPGARTIPEPLRVFAAQGTAVMECVDEQRLPSGLDQNRTLAIWSMTARTTARTIPLAWEQGLLGIHPSGREALIARAGTLAAVPVDGNPARTLAEGEFFIGMRASFSSDGSRVVLHDQGARVVVIRYADGAKLWSADLDKVRIDRARRRGSVTLTVASSFVEGDRRVAVATADGAWLFDAESGAVLGELGVGIEAAYSRVVPAPLAFLGSKRLWLDAVGHHQIWDVATGALARTHDVPPRMRPVLCDRGDTSAEDCPAVAFRCVDGNARCLRDGVDVPLMKQSETEFDYIGGQRTGVLDGDVIRVALQTRHSWSSDGPCPTGDAITVERWRGTTPLAAGVASARLSSWPPPKTSRSLVCPGVGVGRFQLALGKGRMLAFGTGDDNRHLIELASGKTIPIDLPKGALGENCRRRAMPWCRAPRGRCRLSRRRRAK